MLVLHWTGPEPLRVDFTGMQDLDYFQLITNNHLPLLVPAGYLCLTCGPGVVLLVHSLMNSAESHRTLPAAAASH